MHKIFSLITAVVMGIGSYLGLTYPDHQPVAPALVQTPAPQHIYVEPVASEATVGAVTKPAGLFTYYLGGGGLSSSASSFTLTSFTLPQNHYAIQDTDLSDTFWLTLEPGNTNRQEFISCTTVGTNTGSTVTISGCTRGLSPVYPYAASTTLQFSHSGGSAVILSDAPQLFNEYAAVNNDAVITGTWTGPTPLSADQFATKAYADQVGSGTTTVSNDRLVVAGTAGEVVATGTLVYFNGSSQRWNKVNAASSTTYDDKFLGITQSNGTNGVAITRGILLKGRDTTQTGLTPGAIYYAATGTATGTITSTLSAQTVGTAVSATVLYFDPFAIDVPTENADNTFNGTNTFSGVTVMNPLVTGQASTTFHVYTSTSTWTKPAGLEYITIWVCGAGGNGGSGSASSDGGAGGGGGGCGYRMLDSIELAATTSVGISFPGNGNAIFGSYCSSTPGTSAVADVRGTGGVAAGCDLNFTGSGGTGGFTGPAGPTPAGSVGGSSQMGVGGGGGTGPTGSGDPGSGYGGGGGGGGGSNASSNGGGGSGAGAAIIITEYY